MFLCSISNTVFHAEYLSICKCFRLGKPQKVLFLVARQLRGGATKKKITFFILFLI